jgi:hypothetical protein
MNTTPRRKDVSPADLGSIERRVLDLADAALTLAAELHARHKAPSRATTPNESATPKPAHN